MNLLPCCVPRDVNYKCHQMFKAFLVGEDFFFLKINFHSMTFSLNAEDA